MTRKRRRLWMLLACGLGLGSATALTLSAFSDNLVFFVSPVRPGDKAPAPRPHVRLGGLVEQGSVSAPPRGRPAAQFRVTDGAASVTVTYVGILPDLFREGQGVVTLGTLQPDGTFRASEVLAKHDETYMPKEVADALKKSGHWNPGRGPPPPAATWNTLVPPRSRLILAGPTGITRPASTSGDPALRAFPRADGCRSRSVGLGSRRGGRRGRRRAAAGNRRPRRRPAGCRRRAGQAACLRACSYARARRHEDAVKSGPGVG